MAGVLTAAHLWRHPMTARQRQRHLQLVAAAWRRSLRLAAAASEAGQLWRIQGQEAAVQPPQTAWATQPSTAKVLRLTLMHMPSYLPSSALLAVTQICFSRAADTMPAWSQPNDELEEGIRGLAAWRALVCVLQQHVPCKWPANGPCAVPTLTKAPCIQADVHMLAEENVIRVEYVVCLRIASFLNYS